MPMFDIEKFIGLIRERRLLWDNKSKEYAVIINRDLAWIEIGEGMYKNWLELSPVEREEKVKLMKSKWRHLRDNYLRSLKLDKNSKKKKYLYAEHLEFLIDTFGNRIKLHNEHVSRIKTTNESGETSSCNNVLIDLASKIENDRKNAYANGHTDSGSKIRDDNYEANESCSSDTIEDTFQLIDAQPTSSSTKQSQNTKPPTLRVKLPTFRPKLQTSTPKQPTLGPKQPTLEPKQPTLEPNLPTEKHLEDNPQKEEDVDLMFFNSLLPDYKQLDEEEKLDFRIKCLQFIQNARKSRKS